MTCQLTSISKLKQKNTVINNIWQMRVKTLWTVKRNAVYLINKFVRVLTNRIIKTSANPVNEILQKGDLVRVRSKDEIRSMLNDHEKFRGCQFINEMYEHCDKTYKILKTVDHFFDEAKQKLCRCKDIVLLEGATCSGKKRIYSEHCDRNCFFFWHKEWLRKLE